MDAKTYRLREFIRPVDGRSLVVDASAGLWMGPLPGLGDLAAAVEPLLPLVDGLVAGPGQLRRIEGRTRSDGALLARADWTNALRPPDFVLPPDTVHALPLVDAADVLDLGASGLVVHFLLGYEEGVEAGCLRRTVELALAAGRAGLPLIVDVEPTGPRVALRDKAIELGASYAIEGGADGVAVPWPGAESFGTIITMAAGLPVWLKPAGLDPDGGELAEALARGAAGPWLGEAVFAQDDPVTLVEGFRSVTHP